MMKYMREKQILNSFLKEKTVYYFLIIIATILFCMGSYLNPFSTHMPCTDELVWLYIANGMHEGLIPYVDMFDHKGPLLYIIYYLGIGITGGAFWGVWVLILLTMITSMIFCYKTTYILTASNKISFISALLVLTAFGYFTYMAGLKEVFALPFIFISLYYFAKYIISNKIKTWELLIIGAAFACVLMITPTLAILWTIILPYIIARSIIVNKSIKEVGKVFPILLGCLVILLPQITYLHIHDALNAFVECYITFNLEYSEDGFLSTLNAKRTLLKTILTTSSFIFAEIFILISLFSKDKKKKELAVFSVIFYILTILVTCIIGNAYNHYMIVCIPCLCIPCAWGIECLSKILETSTSNHWKILAILLICAGLIGYGGIYAGMWQTYNTNKYSNTLLTQDEARVIEIIDAHTTNKDTIQVFANKNYFYLATETTSATRFSYLPPTGYQKYNDEMLADINSNRPKIIVNSKSVSNSIMSHLSKDYRLIETCGIFEVYMRGDYE